jgi:hypothetical protein
MATGWTAWEGRNSIPRRCKIFLYVRFEVFTAVTMKNVVVRDVAPCRSCVNRRFGGTCNLHLQSAATCSRWFLARGSFYPENGGDTFLRNVGSQKIYNVPHPKDGILQDFYPLFIVQTGCGAHSFFYPVTTGEPFAGGKAAGE